MDPITVHYHITAAQAVQLGLATHGTMELRVEPERLTTEQRAIVVRVIQRDGDIRNLWCAYDDNSYPCEFVRADILSSDILKSGDHTAIVAAAADALIVAERTWRAEHQSKIAKEREDLFAAINSGDLDRFIRESGGHNAADIYPDIAAKYPGINVLCEKPYFFRGPSIDVFSKPEIADLKAKVEAEIARRVEAARPKIEAKFKAAHASIEAERQARADQAAWIEAHGSERLRRMASEKIEHDAAYRDERLAAERPGWQWERDLPGDIADPRNPPIEAFSTLDAARAIAPDARLAWYTVEHVHDEMCDESEDYDGCPKYDIARYVAVSEFLDRDIVFGAE